MKDSYLLMDSYEEASSKKEAYEKECYLWHQYYPRDNDIHPDHPDDMRYLKCPVSTCKKHYSLFTATTTPRYASIENLR